MRARERNVPILNHPEIAQYYRRHGNNLSNDHELIKRELLLLLKDSLARRNQPPA